jgi:hypothetical protein
VLIGATPEGRKELVGFTDSAREDAQDWRDLLLDLKRAEHWKHLRTTNPIESTFATVQALLQESLAVATKTGAMKPGDLARGIVDTTVQPKNITFSTDAKLLNRARERLVTLAKKLGVELRQSYTRVGKFALIQYQRPNYRFHMLSSSSG